MKIFTTTRCFTGLDFSPVSDIVKPLDLKRHKFKFSYVYNNRRKLTVKSTALTF